MLVSVSGSSLRAQPPVKVCVAEAKPATKVVYSSRCQAFWVPRCHSLLARLLGRDGGCECGEPRSRRVLVKKNVPTYPTVTCVVKDG